MQLSGLNREPNPFDSSGVLADADGVRRYQDLHSSLVAMLDASVRAAPQAEALVEVGGDRISYQQMWDRAARVAGGLRQAGVSPGDRVAIRLPNSIDWMLAFAGILLAIVLRAAAETVGRYSGLSSGWSLLIVLVVLALVLAGAVSLAGSRVVAEMDQLRTELPRD